MPSTSRTTFALNGGGLPDHLILLAALATALMLASGLALSQQRLGNLSSNPYGSGWKIMGDD